MASAILQLKDGRNLSYAEYGKPDGIPVVLMHGTPGSRHASEIDIACANETGARLIVPERPGYGLSDLKAAESVSEWVDDLIELVDALKIDRFGVVAASGGTPFMLASAIKLADRITRCVLIGAIAPYGVLEPPAETPHTRESLVGFFQPMAETVRQGREAILQLFKSNFSHAPDLEAFAHPAVGKWAGDMMLEAFRAGSGGAIQDWYVLTRTWDVDPGLVRVPVHLLQGDLDNLEAARYLQQHIPGSELTILPGLGHMLKPDYMCMVLSYFQQA